MARTSAAHGTTRAAEAPASNSQPWMHGRFYWNELRTRNPEQAMAFYRDTVGWRFERSSTPDGQDYWLAWMGEECVAGLFPLTDEKFKGVPESWMSFLAVDDVDSRVAKAIHRGAKLVMPIFNVPNVGRIAMVLEPSGAGVGWITPVAPQTGVASR